MRAAVFEGPETGLVLTDIDIEEPRMGEVMVKIENCGICHSDLTYVEMGSMAPIVLGHEAAGVVEMVGPGVSSVSKGDKVLLTPLAPCGRCYWCVRDEPTACADAQAFATGMRPDGTSPFSRDGAPIMRGLGVAGFGQYTVVTEGGVSKLPPDTPLDIACLIGCAVQTGVGAVLNTAGVEPGSTVAVTGLGGIGISVIQGARIAGATTIIASDPVESRRDAAQHFGATHVIDPTNTDLAAFAMEQTGNVGVDYAFEAAGVAALVDSCLNATRRHGTCVVVGADASLATVAVMPVLLATYGRRIVGSLLGDCHPQRDIPRLVALWQSGQLDLESMISHRLDLADIDQGFDYLREANGIRTVLNVGA